MKGQCNKCKHIYDITYSPDKIEGDFGESVLRLLCFYCKNPIWLEWDKKINVK